MYVRATVLMAASDFFQVLIDDGSSIAITTLVPARECAKHEDIGSLRPIRRRGGYIER